MTGWNIDPDGVCDVVTTADQERDPLVRIDHRRAHPYREDSQGVLGPRNPL